MNNQKTKAEEFYEGGGGMNGLKEMPTKMRPPID